MKWQIAAVGKPSLAYAKDGVAEYRKRLRRYATVSVDMIQRDAGKEKNGQQLLQLSEGALRLVLDERGKSWTTEAFAKRVEDWQMDGVKRVSILIGGADGHSEETRLAADHVISMSGFTLQHELALLVLMEQLYRVHTLMRGEPYHR
ncbi:MAG: 23S rRNA (pseudouridine(1915)-N(3))-methyltransferase RlmH [Verrucomicrobiales bacterium]|nr:23S rRNA (pseudouridine(1915)-N(3))-methyltransferase RlmH [Verrucomicrobiales bacterium]